jgi:hypothetical protein
MKTVKKKTPAAAPIGREADAEMRDSISSFMRRPARHICTVSVATEIAATSASGPSSSS